MKPYSPSNGTDGMIFTDQFCDKCYKQYRCTILLGSLLGKQPKQWVYENGKPTCTSFNPNRPKQKGKVKPNLHLKLF